MSGRSVNRLFESVPSEPEAEERAWTVVHGAYAAREPAPRRRHARAVLAVAALAAVVGAATLSPPGRAVVDAVRKTIGIEHAQPALFRLPSPGRVLVSGAGGAWVVATDGSKRRLGDFRAISSPRSSRTGRCTGRLRAATFGSRAGAAVARTRAWRT